MEEKQNNKKDTLTIIGLIALIAALVLGVKLVFAGLDAAIPDLKYMASQSASSQSTSVDAPSLSVETDMPAPNFCPQCGDGLPESFRWGQFCPYCGEKVE